MRLLILLAALLPLAAQEAPKPEQEPAAPQKTGEAKPEEPKAEAPAGAAAAAPVGPASERVFSGSVDVGYRWVGDIGGNSDAYRTVVNLGDGPKVFNFDLSLQNPNGKWYDKVTAFGMGWGGDPNQTLRFDATKQRLYDFHFDYRNIAYYNFLPSFANPAVTPNPFQTERGYDIRRRSIDTELRFRPGTRIVPYLAYNRNWGSGRGVVDFVADLNEYPVSNGLYDNTDQYRAGVNLEFSRWHVTLEQGGTTFKDDQTVSTNDRNPGNRQTTFLGQTLFLSNLLQAYRVRGHGIFERALVTATPFSWLDLNGSLLYSEPQTDTQYTQVNTGNFVNQSTLQFFTSGTEFGAANANRPHTSGTISLEIRPLPRVRILEAWMTDRYHTASSLALTDLTAFSPGGLTTLGGDRLEANYNRQQVQVNIDVTRWLTVRAGHRYVWGDAVVRAPAATDLTFQQGELSQQVGLAGFQMRFGQKVWINGDAELASADRVYFRTSLSDYRKGTVRARYQLLPSLTLTGNFAALTNENPNPAIRFSLESYQTSAGFLWNPAGGKRITVLGDYTYSTFSSDAIYYVPQTLTPETSTYREQAHTATTLVDFSAPGKYGPRLSVGGSLFTSSGSRPTSFYTPLFKLGVPIYEKVQWFSEYRWYGMSETLYSYEGFRAHVFMTGLRLLR